MMKRAISFVVIFAMLAMFAFPIAGHAAYNNWHGTDRTRLLQRELPYDLTYSGAGRGGVSTIVSTVTPLTAAHIAFGYVQLTHGSKGDHQIPNGVRGQEITFELLADPSYIFRNYQATAMVKTGWVSIHFEAAHSRVTLVWLNDTNGWIITSVDGVRVVY